MLKIPCKRLEASGPLASDIQLVDCEAMVDHDGPWVKLLLHRPDIPASPASLSPCEAKVLATALEHYAERAQWVRNHGDAEKIRVGPKREVSAEDKAAVEEMPLHPAKQTVLRPCPFCGKSVAYLISNGDAWHVVCSTISGGCGAEGPIEHTPSIAEQNWNTIISGSGPD